MPLRNVPLPIAEKPFLELSSTILPNQGISDQSSPKHELFVPKDSLIAHSVIVNQVFSQIEHVNSRAVSGELQGIDLLETVKQVSLELDSWSNALPARMRNTPDNLAHWTSEGFGNIFVVLHMNYYHLCQILFYQFLHGSANQINEPHIARQYAQNCRLYATDLCKLIHLASETPGAELLNSIVGHVLTIASTIQLHILLFSENAVDTQHARGLLERNFEILTQLKIYWPCTDISFSRFESFHRACLRCQDDSHFRMDQWMLKFLLEFATPLTDRYNDLAEEDNSPRPWSLINGSA